MSKIAKKVVTNLKKMYVVEKKLANFLALKRLMDVSYWVRYLSSQLITRPITCVTVGRAIERVVA